MSTIFDIVIPVGPNDINIIYKQIEYTKKNIIGYRNIYIIFCNDDLHIQDCITISENIFPFSLNTVSNYHGKRNRNGWYLQQLLKLYSGLVIPDILDKYLVIDSDTFFIKPTIFYENGKSIYNYSTEYHLNYFDHMNLLHQDLFRVDISKSGICHYMFFETKYIKELFSIVENKHNDIFYNIFLKNVIDFNGSGASEYEIYFNFILSKYSNNIILRQLNFINTSTLNNIDDLKEYNYISYHWYLR